MIHKPIVLTNIGLSFPHKTCFEDFSAQIHYGNKITIIGRNGIGKSTLLKIILGLSEASNGHINIPKDVTFGYVPQIINDKSDLSGRQRFNAMLTSELAKNPNVLVLDEPTNHLDIKNRKSLMRMLQSFHGTILMVSHDIELLRTCIGDWKTPKVEEIGYLDQHYSSLTPNKNVYDHIYDLIPAEPQVTIRLHLNNFLFRKNEEVNALTITLSGGEKARLSLACIAAKTPKLLILDEITNNIDLETREHIIQILANYPKAIIVISHDQDFLKAINVTDCYKLASGKIIRKFLE